MNRIDRIYIKTHTGESLNIPIYDKITVITGGSATGKTKMLEWLKACKVGCNTGEIVDATVDLNNIIVVTDQYVLAKLLSAYEEEKIVFIDRVSLWWTAQIADYVRNSRNLFVLIGHRNTSELTNQDAVLGMKHDGKHYECYQIYENGLFNPTDEI